MEKEISYSDLSTADLVALHTNYWMTMKLQPGARYALINDYQFKAIEAELYIRILHIKIKP